MFLSAKAKAVKFKGWRGRDRKEVRGLVVGENRFIKCKWLIFYQANIAMSISIPISQHFLV